MRVLSFWQPWATLCVAPLPGVGRPAKRFETRSWKPNVPLPFTIAIHATATIKPTVRAVLSDETYRNTLKRLGYYPGDPAPMLKRKLAPPVGKLLPLQAIVGVADVVAVMEAPKARELIVHQGDRELAHLEVSLGDYSDGRWTWQLANVRELINPIHLEGRREQLWDLWHEVEQVVRRQLLTLVA